MNSTHCLLVFKLYKKIYFTSFLQKLLYKKSRDPQHWEKKSCSTVGIISPVNVDRSAKFKKILVK